MQNRERAEDSPRISADEAKRLFDARRAVFVDVRSPAEYEDAHVPGAISMPLAQIPRRYTELALDRQLIFY